MNLTNAKEVKINNKTVQQIRINGNIVYDSIQILLTSAKSYVETGGELLLNIVSEKLKNKNIKLYSVVNMTRTLLDTLETDENGEASYTYTGTGAGSVGFVAVYDETDSNIVVIDDYVPAVDSVGLAISNSNVSYGTSVTLTATVKDQHNQNISSGTVTFKDGSSTIGTGSVSSGVATLTISTLGAGSHSLTAEISNKTSSAVALSVNKLNTATIITPPTLYYKDEFDVEGTLKDSNGTGIVGATVTLLWNDGSDHTATATTGTGGAYRFHRDAPTSIREYTFKVTYAGGDNYNASETGTSSVTVNKELTVLTVTSPTSGTAVSNDFTVTGTLKDDDGHVLDTSATVLLRLQRGAWFDIGTATVGSDGSFSITADIDELVDGSNTLRARYSESSHYGSSYHEFSVSKVSYDGMAPLEKSAGKSILSYADSGATPETEFCTVRAQLTNSGSAASISGVPVVFGAYQGDTLITGSEQSVNTDSNGQASYTYHSQGLGDVIIKAVPDNRTLVSKTYEVEDCSRFDDASIDKTSNYSTFNLSSLTHSVDHYEAYRSIGSSPASTFYSPIYVDETLPSDYEISVDMSTSSVTQGFQNMISIASSHLQTYSGSTEFGIITTLTRNSVFSRLNGTGSFKDNNNQNLSANTYYKYILQVEGTTVTAIIKDMQDNIKYSNSMTVSFAQDHKKWSIIVGESAHTVKWKNLKIKPL